MNIPILDRAQSLENLVNQTYQSNGIKSAKQTSANSITQQSDIYSRYSTINEVF